MIKGKKQNTLFYESEISLFLNTNTVKYSVAVVQRGTVEK